MDILTNIVDFQKNHDGIFSNWIMKDNVMFKGVDSAYRHEFET